MIKSKTATTTTAKTIPYNKLDIFMGLLLSPQRGLSGAYSC